MEKLESSFEKTYKKKKIIILVCIIGVLMLTVGTSMAYYLANIVGEEKSVSGQSGKLDISFTNGPEVTATNFAPVYDSDKASSSNVYRKNFTLSNTGTGNLNAEYEVYLVISQIAEELKSEYMKWELINDGNIVANGNLIGAVVSEDGIKLTPNKLQLNLNEAKNIEFRLWLSYSDSVDQMNMLNKSLTAKLKVKANETIN